MSYYHKRFWYKIEVFRSTKQVPVPGTVPNNFNTLRIPVPVCVMYGMVPILHNLKKNSIIQMPKTKQTQQFGTAIFKCPGLLVPVFLKPKRYLTFALGLQTCV